MIKEKIIGHTMIKHYYNPGENLDDLKLKKLHNELILINKISQLNIDNRMLYSHLSLNEIRTAFSQCIVGVAYVKNEICAFLISPLLNYKNKKILHGGLIIIANNPGFNLVSLISVGNALYAYEKCGHIYATNISSTPSIVESFSELIPKSWPGPDENLKVAPKNYREIISILKSDYIDINFPSSENIEIDYKRFILKSKSTEMGFNTNFYQLSKAEKMKYNVFCKTWVNYDQEEDIIQVGEINLIKYLRMRIFFMILKFQTLLRINTMGNEKKIPDKKESLIIAS